jgi:hypothetical protein
MTSIAASSSRSPEACVAFACAPRVVTLASLGRTLCSGSAIDTDWLVFSQVMERGGKRRSEAEWGLERSPDAPRGEQV